MLLLVLALVPGLVLVPVPELALAAARLGLPVLPALVLAARLVLALTVAVLALAPLESLRLVF
jgi:hypothetical protein